MAKHSYTIQQLAEACQASTTIRQVLLTLGLTAYGGNNDTVKRLIAEHNIDISHFTGKRHNAGKRVGHRTDTNDYLNNTQQIGSFRLKNRLISDGILKPQCSCCGGTAWLDRPMPLELDHIDGDSTNNNLQNLRLLCPNCHSLTPTYRGKNQKRAKQKTGTPPQARTENITTF